jgi:hypothetical protein
LWKTFLKPWNGDIWPASLDWLIGFASPKAKKARKTLELITE